MNTKRNSVALIHFQDKVWAMGGVSNGQRSLNTIETYNLGDNEWTPIVTRLLQKRWGHKALVNNDNNGVV